MLIGVIDLYFRIFYCKIDVDVSGFVLYSVDVLFVVRKELGSLRLIKFDVSIFL